MGMSRVRKKYGVTNLIWKSVLAAFILLMTSPTLPTTAANTKIPSKNMKLVNTCSYGKLFRKKHLIVLSLRSINL